jgi:hypothetical protein
MWLFFRNDDLGWDPANFARLVTLFARHDQKLNAAAIPSLLTDRLVEESIPYSYQAAPFLQVVAHGWAHQNFEAEGKKCEYGPARESRDVFRELADGNLALKERFENYFPCFVPPWNRFDNRFLPLLKEAGFLMLSRERESAQKVQAAPIPEFNVCLDLHTRSGGERLEAKDIYRQLAALHEAGRDHAGVMLHHAKMTDADFATLDEVLKNISKRSIQSVFFSDMVPGFERRDTPEVSHV